MIIEIAIKNPGTYSPLQGPTQISHNYSHVAV